MLGPHADFAPEGPQSVMEVAPAEAINTMDSQAVDEPQSALFTWKIENLSNLNKMKQYSEVFFAGGCKWRVLIFPKGNKVDSFSMYLDVADASTLPHGWSIHAHFSLAVVNQIHSFRIEKETHHQFSSTESDWGFTSFMPLSELYGPGRGYIVNDTCRLEADVSVDRVVNCPRESKKETGYAGLKDEVVRFRSLEKPKEDEFSLKLSKEHNYDEVVEYVAHHLSLDDPSKIRLTSHNCYSQQPNSQPIMYRGVKRLMDMLVHYHQISDILYYEVLDVPLPELQGLKTLKVTFRPTTKDEVVIHTIRLPRQSTSGDVINDLKRKVELSHPDAELRLLEIFNHKIYKIFPLQEKIENIDDQNWSLRAEEIPEEEKNVGPHDSLIHIFHFMKDTAPNQVHNFGDPFLLAINDNETMGEIKVRIQKKLCVPDEEFSKWSFAFLSVCRLDYLQDSDIVSDCFQRTAVHFAWEQGLGLEHSDNSPKWSFAANQMAGTVSTPRVLGVNKIEDHVRCFRDFRRDEGVSLGEFLGKYLTLWKEASDVITEYEASNRLIEHQVPSHWRAWIKGEMDDLVTKDQVTYQPVCNFPELVSRVFKQWARDGAPPISDSGM